MIEPLRRVVSQHFSLGQAALIITLLGNVIVLGKIAAELEHRLTVLEMNQHLVMRRLGIPVTVAH